jgi:hypothetical protein
MKQCLRDASTGGRCYLDPDVVPGDDIADDGGSPEK